MAHLLAMPVLLSLFVFTVRAAVSSKMGINYGQLGSSLPPPPRAMELIRSLRAARVKLYDANPAILSALAGTSLQASVMLPNQLIPAAAANQSFSDHWVASNLLPFRHSVHFRFLLVGNEVLSDNSLCNSTWPHLVTAMERLHHSLKHYSLRRVKVGTTLAMDALGASFPPSAAGFREDVAVAVVALLCFLRKSRSFYFVDVYPYLTWAANSDTIALDYALMEAGAKPYTDPGSGLAYTNLLDQQLDAVYAAMARLGFPDVPLVIAETGWPHGGDYDQAGANLRNAATFNRNLARRMMAKPPPGTPARPGKAIPSFVFALFDEDRKPGPGTERHWGLFYQNETAVYGVDLAGRAAFAPLPPLERNEPYKGKIWCVAVEEEVAAERVNATELGAAVAYACGQGKVGMCDEIRPGGRCYRREAPALQASYAFNAYWQQFRKYGATCFFNGLAAQTIHDPSFGHCRFPSELRRGEI